MTGSLAAYMVLGILNLPGSPSPAQPDRVKVIDRIELPGQLQYGKGTSFTVEFRETWLIDPSRALIVKQVDDYALEDHVVGFPPPSARGAFLTDFTYEFPLADPETGRLNRLHPYLRELVRRHGSAASSHDLETQLLSVEFTENWYLEEGENFRKRVTSLTPVIWQRRQTVDGTPLDDPDSGLPVYFKTRLPSIPVRSR